MNELMTLGLLAAGAYIVSRQAAQSDAVPQTVVERSVQTATTQEQAVIDDLQASGQLVTGIQQVTTPAGQSVSVIVAPTPDVPNRGVVLSPDDLARIQGRYIPQITISSDIQEQLAYFGYPSLNDLMPQLISGRVFFYGPAAQRIKFIFKDWEYWRTVNPGGGGSPASETQVPPELWNTPLTQEEYFAMRDRYGLYPASLRGLGCPGCSGGGLGCAGCAGRVWLT